MATGIGAFVSFGDLVAVPEGAEVTAASGVKALGDGQYISAKMGTVKVDNNRVMVDSPTAPFVPPSAGDVVYARVARITTQKAECIIVADQAGRPNNCGYRGHIRVQDVRYYDIDAVAIADCFRPGDLIKCKVLSIGDSRSYLLTTSGTDASLGVVMATSANGKNVLSSLGADIMVYDEVLGNGGIGKEVGTGHSVTLG
ncbi:3'-5' exoribonuclease, putative [Perkinsus marinus ATCC 50983]|uniref:3'-5' exoribonuclease, putative n=1 Tax=Perkinsus marinus (strain ATCC 50983 / TXsc) TaxID=423536 RepID=C5LAL5_PERM5|nr:3'-5' exoribonuclease, putative [Perkinsus marinus ATCC 50983]EER06471.1 3'-5' exoribonuclease, putative [Perkinsus marinus ATCC 50983]|eukprot:XP_002774655.1 3'-5' exoribonuclease, putative [Perkinsus marinus ATCC 50983]